MKEQKPSDFAKEHIDSLNQKGIMSDDRPKDYATREELATVGDRIINHFDKELAKLADEIMKRKEA